MPLILCHWAVNPFLAAALSELHCSGKIPLPVDLDRSVQILALDHKDQLSGDDQIVDLRCQTILLKEEIMQDIHGKMAVPELKQQRLLSPDPVFDAKNILLKLFLAPSRNIRQKRP